MAKRKIKKHKAHHRRRVSGKGAITDTLLKFAGLAGGGLATAFAVQALNTAMGSNKGIPMWLAPGMSAVTGLTIPHMVKNNPLVQITLRDLKC